MRLAPINNVSEVQASAGCSPPIEDPENEDTLIERCEGHTNSIDKETGEKIGPGSVGPDGIEKRYLSNEFMKERFLDSSQCVRGQPTQQSQATKHQPHFFDAETSMII